MVDTIFYTRKSVRTRPRLLYLKQSNWNGVVIQASKTAQWAEIPFKDLLGATVYVLFTVEPEPVVYVGSTETPDIRLTDHLREKQWWDTFVAASSEELTYAHARKLESRLYQLANRSGRATVFNKKAPTPGKANWVTDATSEMFLAHLLESFDLLGIPWFEEVPLVRPVGATVYELRLGPSKVATGYFWGAEFVVEKGSWAKETETHGATGTIRGDRTRLLNDGFLKKVDQGWLQFTGDVVFPAPSRAGDVITGSSSTGFDRWKDMGTHKTMKEILDAKKAEADAERDDVE